MTSGEEGGTSCAAADGFWHCKRFSLVLLVVPTCSLCLLQSFVWVPVSYFNFICLFCSAWTNIPVWYFSNCLRVTELKLKICEWLVSAGLRCEDLSPVKDQESGLIGDSVLLSYKYTKFSPGDFFFWYRQHPGEPPEFLISHTSSGSVVNNPVSGLEVLVEGSKLIQLRIVLAAAEDSAVFYCAVRPTVTGNPPALYKNLIQCSSSGHTFIKQ